MIAQRPLLLAVTLAFAAAGCGSSTTTPSSTNAGSCQLVGGKVQVVVVYNRDRTLVPAAMAAAFAPTLALIDQGAGTITTSTNLTLTRIDDYRWTITVFVVPNSAVTSHNATVIDPGLSFAGGTTPYAVIGVTANGVQVKKVTLSGIAPFPGGVEVGYFGVDACGNISV